MICFMKKNEYREEKMATKLYLIKHGESQANQKDVFLGHTDLGLTERGRKQAMKTAEFFQRDSCRCDLFQ